jgi:drug/metabolite transporter (DMT)-like permease
MLPLANVITVNYLVAYLIGQMIDPNNPITALGEKWIWVAAIIGVLFIIFFFIIGISSKIAGIAITTVASKMSVIIPILFSILFFHENIVALKIIGICLALVGVFLTVYQKNDSKVKQNILNIILPLVLFVGMGLIDSLLKYTQDAYITDEKSAFFTSSLFGISFLTGLIYTFFRKDLMLSYLNKNIYFFGTLLGIVNYGSIYFLIRALNSNIFESSIIFGINNVGIVVLSVLLGILIFKEKISKINIIGILSSILAIATLSFA